MSNPSTPRIASVFLVLCVTACTAATAPDVPTAEADAPIQGGIANVDDAAVGLSRTASGYCSATLIAPDVVLTAGHCVASRVTGFYTTDGTTTATVLHAVKAQKAFTGYRPGSCPNSTLDIGLLQLTTPITNITPKRFGDVPEVGATCVAIGFGRHLEGGVLEREKKRSATEIVDSFNQSSILIHGGSGIADHGDSGGPLLCGDVIVGTVSCHTDGDGASHQHEYYGRVSEAAAWITSQMQQWSATAATDGGAPSL